MVSHGFHTLSQFATMNKTPKFQISIDYDTADQIVICSLKDSIDLLAENTDRLLKRQKLSNHERQVLSEELDDLSALRKVYYYYAGNLK